MPRVAIGGPSRRWYMDQLEREVTMQTAPLKLYLTEDFQEAARRSPKNARPDLSRAAEPSRSRAVRHPAQSLGNPTVSS